MHDGIQPLDVYHVGGDEVAKGAWSQSPACHRLKQQLTDIKTHFIERSPRLFDKVQRV